MSGERWTAGETAPARRARGIVLVTISAILWGFSGSCGEMLSQNCGVPVEWVVVQRLVWSAVILAVAALIFDRRNCAALLKDRTSVIRLICYGTFGVICCQWFYQEVIAWTNAGTGTLMEQLGLIIVLFVTCLRERRKPVRREMLGLILALAGAFIICTQGNLGSLAMAPEGLAWGIAAAIGMALYLLLPVPLLKDHGSFTVMALAMAVAALVSIPLFRPWNYTVALTPEVLFGTAGMTICGTALAYLLFLQGVRDTGPVIAGLLDTIELVAAFLISHVWLGTAITVWDAVGAVCIMAMMALVTRKDVSANA